MKDMCPLFSISYHRPMGCAKDSCAWYDKENRKCSMLSLIEMINSMETISQEQTNLKRLVSPEHTI